MTKDRDDLLARFISGPERVREAVGALVGQALDQPGDGGWTIRDVLVHLADAEILRAARIRLILGDNGVRLPVWDENAWHDRLSYGERDPRVALATYEAIVSSLEERSVDLRLPKFELTYDVSLVEPLTALGMADAFTAGAADFSGIDGSRDLCISDVFHKAFVSVDEAGTEAAAATAVVIELVAYPGPPERLTIDRPFLFVIRDVPTGTILFVGRVVEP